jgi:hypothetical protein
MAKMVSGLLPFCNLCLINFYNLEFFLTMGNTRVKPQGTQGTLKVQHAINNMATLR